MAAQLYDKMQDSQEGVVTAIMDEMAEQQLKQMLMAYVVLVVKQRGVTTDELDDACEDMLARDFDHRIDFQINDALPRLESWGLVTRAGTGADAFGAAGGVGSGASSNAAGPVKLRAMPMETAVAVLSAAWASAYEALGSAAGGGASSGGGAAASSVEEASTTDLITGKASSFATRISAAREELRMRGAEEQAAAQQSKFGLGRRPKAAAAAAACSPAGAVAAPSLAASPTPPGAVAAPSPAPGASPEPEAKKKGVAKFFDKFK